MTLKEASLIVFGMARIGAAAAYVVEMEDDTYGVQVRSQNNTFGFITDTDQAEFFLKAFIAAIGDIAAELEDA